jgi:hypothetical protein
MYNSNIQMYKCLQISRVLTRYISAETVMLLAWEGPQITVEKLTNNDERG